jgi:DNA gyrase subunit A
MKLDEGDQLVGVQSCEDTDHVMLATAKAKSIRFEATDVRVFAGRNSTGVRGVRLGPDDSVISLSILSHAEFSVDEREAYLKRSRAERAEPDSDATETASETPAVDSSADDDASETSDAIELSDERYTELAAQEQFILSVTANGFGKRTSAYEYRITNRGGQGVVNITLTDVKDNAVVASFPVEDDTQLVMVTDGGQLIRTGVGDVRIAGRSTRGVTLFRVAEDERVVTVADLRDDDEEDDDGTGENTKQDAENGAERETPDDETGDASGNEDAADPDVDGNGETALEDENGKD